VKVKVLEGNQTRTKQESAGHEASEEKTRGNGSPRNNPRASWWVEGQGPATSPNTARSSRSKKGIGRVLHVSELSWTKKIGHPSGKCSEGASGQRRGHERGDQETQRIALGLKQMQGRPWTTVIPAKLTPGMVVKGHVTKNRHFGGFVENEPGSKGLLHHPSEISDQKIEKAGRTR